MFRHIVANYFDLIIQIYVWVTQSQWLYLRQVEFPLGDNLVLIRTFTFKLMGK